MTKEKNKGNISTEKNICPKCSYHGAMCIKKVLLPGIGNKVKFYCGRCKQVFYYADYIRCESLDAAENKKKQLKF